MFLVRESETKHHQFTGKPILLTRFKMVVFCILQYTVNLCQNHFVSLSPYCTRCAWCVTLCGMLAARWQWGRYSTGGLPTFTFTNICCCVFVFACLCTNTLEGEDKGGDEEEGGDGIGGRLLLLPMPPVREGW